MLRCHGRVDEVRCDVEFSGCLLSKEKDQMKGQGAVMKA